MSAIQVIDEIDPIFDLPDPILEPPDPDDPAYTFATPELRERCRAALLVYREKTAAQAKVREAKRAEEAKASPPPKAPTTARRKIKAPSTAPASGGHAKPEAEPVGRRPLLTAASDIKAARVHWLWADRLAVGTLAILAGREGLGKSTIGYWIAARITRGELPGENLGKPRSVLVCAMEDSWAHTIVPRLIAAGADRTRVYRIEMVNADDIHLGLSLPRDVHELEASARQTNASLLILDPLLSRLGEKLDTHKDSDVRQALEPMTSVAERAGLAILGVMHHNKSGSSDALQVVMGSKAFTAVARSVHTVLTDPDDETEKRRLFGTRKNNLGRDDLPMMAFTIEGHAIETDDDGTAWTGKVAWAGEVDGTIDDAMRREATHSSEDRSATSEASEWLLDYLSDSRVGGTAPSAEIKRHGHAAGFSESTLKRAKSKLHVIVTSSGWPKTSYWSLSGTLPTQSGQHSQVTSPGVDPTDPTDPTGLGRVYFTTTTTSSETATDSTQSGQLGQSGQSGQDGEAWPDCDETARPPEAGAGGWPRGSDSFFGPATSPEATP